MKPPSVHAQSVKNLLRILREAGQPLTHKEVCERTFHEPRTIEAAAVTARDNGLICVDKKWMRRTRGAGFARVYSLIERTEFK